MPGCFQNMTKDCIVAVCLVTRSELESLGLSFDRAFPVQETPCFGELLRAIDDADRNLWREQDYKITTKGRTTD